MAGDKSHSYELVEMAGTPLQHEDLRGRTNNLASSLARRRYGDIEWIKSAVQFRREEINSRDIAGRPLLQVLLQMPWKGGEDSLEAGLKILINSGAEVDLQDGHGQTALHVAVEERVPRNALQVLLESSGNVNKTDHNYRTPLYYLLDCSDAVDSDMLTTLLEVGANPFCSHIDGETRVDCPLLLLLNQPATLMQNLKVFSQICPEDESRMAKTLLHHALSCSKAPTVDLLLQEIDFIIPKCDSGELLLMATESAQDAEMKVDLLLEHGVDLEATTSSGMGLSHMATRTGSLRILQKATAVTKSVIDKADTTGNTPLHYASSSNSSDKLVVDCVNYLLSSGASTDVENNSGLSPLDTALSFQKKVVVIALLKANPRLPKPRVARTLTIDQLSLLADFDVIAAFRSPMVATLRIVGLIQRISENTFDVQKDQYRELSQELEKTASKMLTFGVSDINSQVLFAAVESGMKKFVSENKVQDYVDRQWLGSVTKLKTSNLTASLYWVLITAFLPFIILFYALPRYGSNYGVFLDDLLMTKRSFAVSHFVHIVYHFSFILLLQYDTTITGGIVTEGSFSGTEISVLCFFLGFLLYNFEQCRMKGTKVYFSSWINVVDVLIILLFTTYFVTRTIEIVYLHIEDGPETSYDLLLLTSVLASLTYAVASFLFIFRFISFLKAFPTIGPIILSFKRIIRDSVAFLVLWQLFILAFSILLSRGYAASAYQKYPEVLECARQWLNGTNSTDIDDQTILQLLDFCGKEAFYQVVPGKVRG
jgi:ankyrin repeat protein